MRINSAAFFHGVKEPVCIVHPPPDEDVNVESVDVPMFTDQLFSSPSEMSFWEYPIYPDNHEVPQDSPGLTTLDRHPMPHPLYASAAPQSGSGIHPSALVSSISAAEKRNSLVEDYWEQA
ncbi:hypothetical protein FRB96_000568 [Tulasnella sp. 330]|nr:hypothetical protein FRB96_000568 [Tulasnella sp. 330]KAG8882084.1 hypothetical protein FRB97_008754 [Tulasnella sp. 331]